ncbi:hypothetical protein AMATHDRAFT_3200 [Amanita thiersii Skay4041]|uniref:Uncharacterized protein n=1 Tax=Amanita thiersii Skay4041 TaxID=703135 RepID=A0A2A9NKW2_9AGAR|nr:hypothetical protein AMATHDRAFT_3200 [Amanita thiersii Skay4041]
MRKIHKILEKDKIATAKQKLVKSTETTKPPLYAQKTLSPSKNTPKDPRKDGAGGWKMVGGNNKISRSTILPPPPNVFKFFITDDETTLPNPKQTDEELTATLNNIISKNVEWLICLGSNHIKSANWLKDLKAIIIMMTCNINKNREDNLPDGKEAFNTLQEVILDLFPDATLANCKPRSKLKFPRVPMQHSDGLPMDNGLLYHYLRKHLNFENVRFSLTPHFECPCPLKPGQKQRVEYTKTVVCKIFNTETGLVAKKCLGSVVKFDNNPSVCEKFIFKSGEDKKNFLICQWWDHIAKFCKSRTHL